MVFRDRNGPFRLRKNGPPSPLKGEQVNSPLAQRAPRLGGRWIRLCGVLIAFLPSLALVGQPGVRAAPEDIRGQAAFDPQLETTLLEHGYSRNVIAAGGRQVLRASQRNYTNTTWSRDLDYAISGYSYVLHDMTVLRDNLDLFLGTTDSNGVVAESYDLVLGRGVNRETWDSMPNVIHASYVYAAKTGDRDWVRQNIATLERIGRWIERLDSNGDGLPDRDIFPYGYYDTVQNGVMHTYALAKFYAAFRELAALERMVGRDGEPYEQIARKLRGGFHLSATTGGYWRSDQAWPIAWRKADGRVYPFLETFGVFQASLDGLIGPEDGWRYRNLQSALHESLGALIAGPTPTKLTLGGYPLAVRRDIVPVANNWMLDAAAPWVAGLHAPAVAAGGYPEDAATVLDAYSRVARAAAPPVLEFAAGPGSRYGTGESGDRGRTWDNATWFVAVYGGHYGLSMTPDALIVAPKPIRQIVGDRVDNVLYQGARINLELDAANRSYRILSDKPARVRLRPVGDGAVVSVNGTVYGPEHTVTLAAGVPLIVQSQGLASQRGDAAFEGVWRRADAPIQRGESGRSWLWGPTPFRTTTETYAESPGGSRAVEYYDKARMEITRPAANRQDRYFVTNGLLVKELVSGRLQTGDAQFDSRPVSTAAVAGDLGTSNPAPAYGVFEPYTSLNRDRRADARIGAEVTATIDAGGRIGDAPARARPETRIAIYEDTLGHNIPTIFWRFLQEQPDDWLFAFGYPISEPYWTNARVGGVDKPVMVQLFERRVLTYTPGNPRGFEVEMGNVGQHYHQWRYGFRPWEQLGRSY